MKQYRSKKATRNVTGWVALDKPYGLSSSQAVAKIKKLFHAEKAGHAGTLDPLATGMLPIALGEATKTVPYIIEGQKHYSFQVTWGEARNTDDLEGQVTHNSTMRPEKKAVLALIPSFIGEITQIPPQFSAIKCEGKRAYDLARQGQSVSISARKILIESLQLVDHAEDNSSSSFVVVCGKGTYIRSIARDMGEALGCWGYVSKLRRTKVEPFETTELIELEALASLIDHDTLAADSHLINSLTLLCSYKHYNIDAEQTAAIQLGRTILIMAADLTTEETVCATYQNKLCAIGRIENKIFYPKRVFKS